MAEQTQQKQNNSGRVFGDRYVIESTIGEGGMAFVYKALDTRLDRHVALKVMRPELFASPEFRQRFRTEAHAVAMVSHPNIVSVYDVSDGESDEYIVMELISGITLRQYMDRKKPVPWKQVLHFSRQIAAALSHAHQRGIIHRDIKPQNIMLLPDGSIKVSDFGIAALESEAGARSSEAVGSLNYLAPEQIRGAGPDARGDIYSLGVMMYEMLTGYKPYTGSSPAEILLRQTTSEIPAVRSFDLNIPEPLSAIVSKAMAPDINARFASAEEMAKALERFAESVVKSENRAARGLEPAADDEPAGPPLKVEIKPSLSMPRKEYVKSVRRKNSISFALGSFALMSAIIAVFVLLWNFWLSDVFEKPRRIEMPSFIGYNLTDIKNSVELNSVYNFTVDYVVNTAADAGTVLKQNPAPGRSLMLVPEGIRVKLSVSTGHVLNEVANVVGMNYREATLKLRNAGFNVEVSTVMTEAVEKDIVISSSPAAGEKISAGSTIYINVSGGAQIEYIRMPNLIGLSESAAVTKLQNAGFTYGGTDWKPSDYDPGTVIAQSIIAFAEAEERSRVTLTVSSGPGY